MFAMDMLLVPMHIKQGIHGFGSAVQIFQGFEQWHYTQRMLNARFFLQEQYSQHITWIFSH